MIVVHPSVQASSVKELVALAKDKPDRLNYGSYGNGSQPHLLFGMLKRADRRAHHADLRIAASRRR